MENVKSITTNATLIPGTYKSTRHGQTKVVHLIEVRGDSVVLKEAPDRVDSFTLPLAKFVKFYEKAA